MSNNDIFFVNQYLEVEDSNGKQIFGKIEEILESKIIISGFAQKSISQLRGILNKVYVHLKGNDASYQFQTDVLSIEYNDPKLILKLPATDEIIRNQKREFFRIQTRQKCILISNSDSTNERTMYTYDLSGGGISFISKQNLQPGEYRGILYLSDSIHGKDDLSFQCQLVYSEPHPNSTLIRNGFEFINVNNLFRDKLIRFLMKEQLSHLN